MNPKNLCTPIHLKADPEMSWPADKAFYLVSSDGLFLCRNHRFFQSSVRVEKGPGELAAHRCFLRLKYPKIPRELFERVVGFFDLVGRRHGAEAAVVLVWNEADRRIEVVVPEQRGSVTVGWSGRRYPMDVQYEMPVLPPHLTPIGDIHSHVELPAYASATDKADELHRPGLHMVVGRIHLEPPDLHTEVCIDGMRFHIPDPWSVLAGYKRRATEKVPNAWFEKLTIQRFNPKASGNKEFSAGTSRRERESNEERCARRDEDSETGSGSP